MRISISRVEDVLVGQGLALAPHSMLDIHSKKGGMGQEADQIKFTMINTFKAFK